MSQNAFKQFCRFEIVVHDHDLCHIFHRVIEYGRTIYKKNHPVIRSSTALASSRKLLTFNTSLHNGAYFFISLSPFHKNSDSGFSQMVRVARRDIKEKMSMRGSL